MRVLHVVASAQRRGAEIFTADLVGAMEAAGVAQHVAMLHPADGPTVRYRSATTMLGADTPTLPGLRVGLPGVQSLHRVIRSWKPDVVQAHGGEALKYAILAAGRAGSTVVYRRIGSTPRKIASGPRRVVYTRLMRRTARVIAVAEAVRQETMEIFRLPAGHVVTIPNGVDERRLQPSKDRAVTRLALGIPEAAEVILSLGALTWEKDPLLHVEVAARVLAERPAAWHVMVGDGPMGAQVRSAVDSSGVRERVRLLGARGDVADLYGASDVLLFASCSEGMPATVIEAGMAGVPVAGYAVAGVSEVVRSGETGLLALPGDAGRLRADVLALLGDAGARLAMGAAARRRCLANYHIDAVAPQYLDLYRTLTVAV
jgi:glycosyltransferase involved in cell wall biosynthesis